MDLSDLRIFRTVVEAGGVTAAAGRLHRVQSNVTARIRKLEDDLGAALFLRENRRMTLTPQGRILLDYAAQLLSLADRAREALHDTAPRGLLRIGTMESTAAVRLPGPLAAYHRKYPDVTIELETGAPRELIARVLAGSLDVALVAEPFTPQSYGAATGETARLAQKPVFAEQLVLVSDAAHPPIRRPADVRLRTALAFHPGCPHRERLEQWFSQGGVTIERVVELASYHTMLGCAAAGMGVALMPASVLSGFAERRRLREHALPKAFRSAQTRMIWRKEMPQAKVTALGEILGCKP